MQIKDITINDYTNRSIAVQGNTKPISETLKALGGRWNPYLKGGQGWIFSYKKKDLVIRRITNVLKEEEK